MIILIFHWSGNVGGIHIFFIPRCCIRCSISLDLNSVPLSECNILGKLNLTIISKNKCIANVDVFLSGMGAVIR